MSLFSTSLRRQGVCSPRAYSLHFIRPVRFVVFILISLTLIAPTASHAIEQDKVKHFSVSYAVSSTGLFALPQNLKWLSPVFTLALGAVKELTDDHFDGGDMLANSAGIGTSLVVLELD